MVALKKGIAWFCAFLGVCMLIGAFTAHKGFGYTVLCLLIACALLVPAAFLFVSAKKSQDKAEAKILKTRIVDAAGHVSTSSAVGRSMVGGFVAGPVGAVVGASTAKQNRETTFLIVYRDGRKKTKKVPNNSPEYELYCKYLDV